MLARIRIAGTPTIDGTPIPSGGGPLRDCDQPKPERDPGAQDEVDIRIVDQRGFNSGTLATASHVRKRRGKSYRVTGIFQELRGGTMSIQKTKRKVNRGAMNGVMGRPMALGSPRSDGKVCLAAWITPEYKQLIADIKAADPTITVEGLVTQALTLLFHERLPGQALRV